MSDNNTSDHNTSDTTQASAAPPRGALVRLLNKIADLGNRLPDPLTLFVMLAVAVILLSVLLDGASVTVPQKEGPPVSKAVSSLLSRDGVRWLFTSAVDNFLKFAPLGPVLTVMLGIGVAERSGLIAAGLKLLVRSVPGWALTSTLVFAGVMSSMAADAGYVVLTPLGAVLFRGVGRHPIAGLAAAFAGVSGGFSANLLVTGLDPLLAGLTAQAAATIDPEHAKTIYATSNYYFMVASVFLITILGTFVTTKIVEPTLGPWDPSMGGEEDATSGLEASAGERRAFFAAMGASALALVGMALLALPDGAPLRDVVKEGQPAVNAYHTFFESIEILITLLFLLPGVVYGVMVGKIKNDRDVAHMTAESMASMGSYIVLAFVAGQFVAYFNHTNLGTIFAFHGADALRGLGLQGTPLVLGFIAVTAIMNLFVGSASAKWALMAPIFVPMMMLMGISPAAAQASYRVGDSVTNIISPLMPYLPIIIIFAQRYDKRTGLGTLMSVMLPYSIAFAIGWTIMLIAWLGFGLELGPGAVATYAP